MSPVVLSTTVNSGSETIYGPFTNPDSAGGAQAVNRSSVAALAFLVWDIMITMDDEVELIWPRTWNYTKYLYFFVRYIPMLVEISILFIGSELTPPFHFTEHDCFIWQVYQGVSASSIVIAVDTILILRVYALYHGNRIIQRVVAIFFAFEVIGIITGLSLALPGVTYDDVCLVTSVPGSLIIYGASSVIFQMFLFTLTVYKFIQALHSGWGDVPLIVLLVRDGTWAFFLLFVVYVGQLGLYGLHRHSYAGVLYGWMITAFSLSGYRVLINLSRLADHIGSPPGRANNTRHTDTNIQFSTQQFESHRYTEPLYDQSFELTSSEERRVDGHGRTFASSQISELSLGK